MFRRSFIILIAIMFAASITYAAKPNNALALKIENLKAAFEGESTASAKYAAYAKKAREEGHPQIALLFEAASFSEATHANNHKSALSELGQSVGKITPKFEVKSTKENLQDAINGETYEVTTMYPDFIKAANENIEKISLNYAYLTEKKHKEMYKNALEQLEAGKESSLSGTYAVCTTCGNTYDGPAPNRCGISMTPKDRFKTFKL
ncbi:MAG TPA: rubrerythrin family protein [Ignavibacteriales bacterium]|nr:rubrerythrin family protein [Ignavibacteriales bacterium]